MSAKPYYVYLVNFLDGSVGYGVKSCDSLPNRNTKYVSSPEPNKSFKNKFAYRKTVLKTFPTKELALAEENRLIVAYRNANPTSTLNARVIGERAPVKAKYAFLSPSGELHSCNNLAKFCREQDVRQPGMSQVHHGKAKHHKCWTKYVASSV